MEDDTSATLDTEPLNALGDFTITLTVVNEAGEEAQASLSLARGRVLTGYERQLLAVSGWQLRVVEEALQ